MAEEGATAVCPVAGGCLLLGRVALGVLNVVWQLPLPLAVAHNLVGALLFACVFWQALQWQTAGRQVLRARRLAVIQILHGDGQAAVLPGA